MSGQVCGGVSECSARWQKGFVGSSGWELVIAVQVHGDFSALSAVLGLARTGFLYSFLQDRCGNSGRSMGLGGRCYKADRAVGFGKVSELCPTSASLSGVVN